MSRFTDTHDLYNKYAVEFAEKLEKLPEREQIDEFTEMVGDSGVVLDLGSGSGRDAGYLHNKGYDVVGVDNSEGLVSEANKRYPGIDFRVMDVLSLDLSDMRFDGIWSKLTILHVEREHILDLFLSLYNLLKPGGVIMVETKAGRGEAMEPVSFNEHEKRLFIYYDLEELTTLLRKSGFVDVEGYYYDADGKHATHIQGRVVVHAKRPDNN